MDQETAVSYITAYKILHRSDKQPDRVEISPEQLCLASAYAEQLQHRLKKPMRVLGWYHSHPHITVWPSHVGEYYQLQKMIMDLHYCVYRYKNATHVSVNGPLFCWTDILRLHKRKELINQSNASDVLSVQCLS